MGKLRARSQVEREQRYQTIISTTKKLFLTQKYDDLTLGKIAKEMNLTRPAIYSYFKSKEELFLEISKLEYVAMGKKLEQTFSNHKFTNRDFCIELVKAFTANQLFLKLLSLHQQAMEEKVDYSIMKNFKEGTLSFFEVLHTMVEKQFPNSSQISREFFIQQINLLLPTMYNYDHIPANQQKVMLSLKIFGDQPLLSTNDFFAQTFFQLSKEVV